MDGRIGVLPHATSHIVFESAFLRKFRWRGQLTLASQTLLQDGAAVLVHTVAMLVVMGVVAVLVFDKLGVDVLRRAWLNVDLLWAVAVVAAGVVTLFT